MRTVGWWLADYNFKNTNNKNYIYAVHGVMAVLTKKNPVRDRIQVHLLPRRNIFHPISSLSFEQAINVFPFVKWLPRSEGSYIHMS